MYMYMYMYINQIRVVVYVFFGTCTSHRTPQNETLLLIAIRHQLERVADKLCEMGVDLSMADTQGNSPLWVALRSRQETIATKLVRV